MGLRLCKDAREDDCLHEFGTYEELEEDSSAGKMGYFQMPELQISKQCSRNDFMAENEHEKLSIDVLRTDETEMKPECYSISPPTDDVKFSIAISTTSCSIAKEQRHSRNKDSFRVVAYDASDGWGEGDIANMGRSYVMPDLEELPEKLLPVDDRERQTLPLIKLDDMKQATQWSKTMPSLFRDDSGYKWNDGRVTFEVEAIKRQMVRLEKSLSPNTPVVPNDIKAEFQDIPFFLGDVSEEVDDENTGVSDSSPNSIDIDSIEKKTAEQMTNSSDSASTKYSEPNSGECLETGNIAYVQQSSQL